MNDASVPEFASGPVGGRGARAQEDAQPAAFGGDARGGSRSDPSGSAGRGRPAHHDDTRRRRAGVSVGTLYQSFPHEQALLYAVLRHHLEAVASAIETACAGLRGQPVTRIADSLVGAYVDAKARRPEAARALYLVSAEFEISELRGGVSGRIRAAVIELLGTATDARFEDLQAVGSTLLAAMPGTVRSCSSATTCRR